MGVKANKKDKPAIYKRVLLKISGEALMGGQEFGIDDRIVTGIAEEIKEIQELGVETAVVVGGGNIFRGVMAEERGMDRVVADHMGMLATMINALALQDGLEKQGVPARVATAIEMRDLAEPYIRRRVIRHLEKGRVVLLAAGTGNPYFTTDSAAALRALEIHAEVLLKATKVDGIYSADPLKDKNAQKYDEVSYRTVLEKNLRVMDKTAISLCFENQLPIIIFNLTKRGSMKGVVQGEGLGSIVRV